MLSTPLTCCSMGVATDCSIVVASAPVKVVVRLICGGMICGNCAIGSPTSDTAPISTVRMAITIATIGRRMKKAEITSSSSMALRRGVGGGRLRGDDRRAVADLLNAVDHHPVARLDARGDDADRAGGRAHLDPVELHLAVGADHRQRVAPLHLD